MTNRRILYGDCYNEMIDRPLPIKSGNPVLLYRMGNVNSGPAGIVMGITANP